MSETRQEGKKDWEVRREELFFQEENGYDRMTQEQLARMEAYCKDYKHFLNEARTEREAVETSVAMARAEGFVPLERGMALKAGDKVYRSNRGKSLMLAVIGQESLASGVAIGAAHLDSPRLDLKPHPLYEDGEFALMKTHYYGGIRKYQWLSIPMELHGVVVLKDGTCVTVRIGDQPGDPVLTIPDLLPHLAGEQSKKPLGTAIDPEDLNLFVGSRPYPGSEGSDRVKLAVLSLLNEKYGITEADFISAELCAVPGYRAVDVGLDRSMIGGYGQDDRVCACAALTGLLRARRHRRTGVCMLADKEEIGSMGVTGMESLAFESFLSDLCEAQGVDLMTCLGHSFCLSGDVSICYDPNYPGVYDKRNSSLVNHGVGLTKYTGSRGKSETSDASAEVMGYVRRLFDREGVLWSVAELGKTDVGGGGTIAMFLANRNIDTVDAGVPVLGMHAPFEVCAKLDCYMEYLAMKAVYED